jgi:hypothetical protein
MSATAPYPRLLRGSLKIYQNDTPGTQPKTINFQYNPAELRRTLASRRPAQQPGAQSAPHDARLVSGPPIETITLSIELDAADQLAAPHQNPKTVAHGLHQALAALELIMYSPTALDEQKRERAANGQVQVAPSNLPLVLLNWGVSRIVPVMVTSFSITEQEFDTRLNPIRAKVDLGLQVLTYLELRDKSIGAQAFDTYQKEKERLAGGYYSGGAAEQTRNLNTDPQR